MLFLHRINSTNPTLAEQMHKCMLRAGLSHRNAGNSAYVITHPSAWLGTAYHFVLENAAQLTPDSTDVDAKLEGYWDTKMSELSQASQEHPLNRRWGEPDSWPNYRLTRGMALEKAKSLIAQHRSGGGHGNNSGHRATEAFLASKDGKLVGQPDVIRGDIVEDYKTGYVLELSDGVEVLRNSYIRQLRLYAYLVYENRGYWPSRGVVDSMKGGRIEIELNVSECQNEALEAIALLDSYNSTFDRGDSPDVLASPSAEACRWCPFQISCLPFWSNVRPDWYESIHAATIQGPLLDSPQMTRDELAFSVSINPQAGTEVADRVLVKPFEVKTFSHLHDMQEGNTVRIVGAHRRSNGALGTSGNTQALSLSDIPVITMINT